MVGIVNPNPEPIKRAIARIRHANGNTVGTGFLVSECCVLTCAHVVIAALGLLEDKPSALDRLVDLDLIDSDGSFVPLTGRVVFWSPVNPGKRGEDIAGLILYGDIPDGCQPLTFSDSNDISNHSLKALGFPKEAQERGFWQDQIFQGSCLAEGWMQMKNPMPKGFSGAPVWDIQMNATVGMVVASINGKETSASYMIPAEILKFAVESLWLIEILSPIYNDSDRLIYSAFRAICPDRWSLPLPQTLAQIVADLWDIPKANEQYSRIVLFMGRLIRDCPMDMPLLKQWVQSQNHNLQDLLKAIPADRQVSEMSYLVIKIEDTNPKSEHYRIEAGFAPRGDRWEVNCKAIAVPEPEKGQEGFTLAQIPPLIDRFLEQVDEFGDLTIEVFLPLDLLDVAVDIWEKNPYTWLPQVIGHEHCVVVRSVERLYKRYEQFKGNWRRKWEVLTNNQPISQNTFFAADGHDPKSLLKQLKPETAIGVKLATIPDNEVRNAIFAAILQSGVPAGLWLRQCPTQCKAQEDFAQILNCCVMELPHQVRQVRSSACDQDPDAHIGHHLSLLWEDPNRIPANIQYTNHKL